MFQRPLKTSGGRKGTSTLQKNPKPNNSHSDNNESVDEHAEQAGPKEKPSEAVPTSHGGPASKKKVIFIIKGIFYCFYNINKSVYPRSILFIV